MKKILEYLQQPLYAGIVGLVIGVVFGLFILGWWWFPVQWIEAEPSNLHSDFQKDYLISAIYAYAADGNSALAQKRFQSLESDADVILNDIMLDPSIDNELKSKFSEVVTLGTGFIPSPITEVTEGVVPPEFGVVTPITEKKGISSAVWLALLCVVLLGIGGALVYILFLRKRGTAAQEYYPPKREERPVRQSVAETPRVTAKPEPVEETPQEQDIPVAQFMTTYMMGDDLYDDSFSIDSPTGEFLGECGVGISETIGVGDPKKVTAFEVWLFDKNDIQTVTKVIMSDHAWNDVTISQRLAAKGEPVLMDAGKHVVLETASLVLEARVVDVTYGQGAMPANSFFDRMTLELAIWPK